jgi:hypothetical protein
LHDVHLVAESVQVLQGSVQSWQDLLLSEYLPSIHFVHFVPSVESHVIQFESLHGHLPPDALPQLSRQDVQSDTEVPHSLHGD